METSGAEIHRGDVFWLAPDGTAEAVESYPHPHVVVQEDVFNHSRVTTVIVCALTSNLNRAHEPGNVLLDVGEGGLPKQSVVVVSQIESVEKARLGARIGQLSSMTSELPDDFIDYEAVSDVMAGHLGPEVVRSIGLEVLIPSAPPPALRILPMPQRSRSAANARRIER